jgi:hypothetical protein
MKAPFRYALAVAALVASLPVPAAEEFASCGKEPQNAGLRQRVLNIREQMDRAEWASDRSEQRRLLELHAKTMHEGMRELNRRTPPMQCREEILQAMMEQLLRHQVALQETQ